MHTHTVLRLDMTYAPGKKREYRRNRFVTTGTTAAASARYNKKMREETIGPSIRQKIF